VLKFILSLSLSLSFGFQIEFEFLKSSFEFEFWSKTQKTPIARPAVGWEFNAIVEAQSRKSN